LERVTRRDVLAAGAGAVLASALPACGRGSAAPTGRIVGEDERRAHRLRSAAPGGPIASRERVGVAIVGGGVAGLSAAWKLSRAGFSDFVLLELADRVGGTARGGENEVSRHPWGAHYVPVPTREQRTLCELLESLGVVSGFDASGRALPAEEHLCRAPEERLFFRGQWSEGLYLRDGASAEDLAQLRRFQEEMAAFSARRDADGRRAFAIPIASSAKDADLLALDGVSMEAWMRSRGFDSPRLRWHVEYGCRDDFGCLLPHVSAWAAIHYFASRAGGDGSAEFLTWPEGNEFLVDRLAPASDGRRRTGALVSAIEPTGDGARVRWSDAETDLLHEVEAKRVVCAVPRFVARRIVRGLEGERGSFSYAPWVVGNLTLDEPPQEAGFPTAWDNVLYESPSLGYVVATHQRDRAERDTVWTWYRPFCGPDPAVERARLVERPWESFRDEVLGDLTPAHPDLARRVRRIDVWRWGHAMVRPEPGFVWGEDRLRAARPLGAVHFGGADVSGLPLFEEAQWSGVRAAEEALAALGVPFTSSL
jgi:phytoene dehydrogenase-like protein